MKATVVAIFICMAGALMGSTCAPSGTLAQYQSLGPNGCDIGSVQFSGFTEIGASPANTIGVILNQGNADGFTFSVEGGQSTPLTLSYTATCLGAAACINDVHDSTTEQPAGAGSYMFSLLASDGLHTSTSLNWNDTFSASKSVIDTGIFFGGSDNQSMSLDVTTKSMVPEPGSWPVLLLSLSLIRLVAFRKRA